MAQKNCSMAMDSVTGGKENCSMAMDSDDTGDIEMKMKKKNEKKKMVDFNVYIYMVLKKVHPDISISGEAMDMMNNILQDMMLKLAQEASKNNKIRKRNSLLVEPDISAAVRQLFPKEIGDHALISAYRSAYREIMEDICDGITKI